MGGIRVVMGIVVHVVRIRVVWSYVYEDHVTRVRVHSVGVDGWD